MMNEKPAREALRFLVYRAFRWDHVPALVAVVIVLLAMVFADHQNQTIYQGELRARLVGELQPLRSKLEAGINGDIQLTRGLAAAIATEPDIRPERFAALAAEIFKDRSFLRSIALAPDMVVRDVYPLKGNERAIGLDYRANADQRALALRARDERRILIAGPLTLVQGGVALVVRIPIFTNTPGTAGTPGTPSSFWGLLSVVIDIDVLYRETGLIAATSKLDIALSGRDGTGADDAKARRTVFFGSPDVLQGDPVSLPIDLPGGTWRLSAVPKTGWLTPPDNQTAMRLLMLVAGACIVGPIFVTGRVLGERQGIIRSLEDKKAELQEVSYRLKVALDASRIGVWAFTLGAEHVVWDDRMKDLYGLPRSETESYAFWQETVHPDDLARVEAEMDRAIRDKAPYVSQFRIRRRDGDIRHIREMGSIYTGSDGCQKMVGVNWDVTEDMEQSRRLEEARREAEEQGRATETARALMEFNALHDPLTALPNRRFLDRRLAEAAGSTDGGAESGLGILHLDIDRFKEVNDTRGHAAGDEVLRHAAAILARHRRPDDFVARTGGDEFVIISVHRSAQDDAEAAARIIDAMSQPFDCLGEECRIGVSIGSAQQSPGQTPAELLVDADIALFEAKKRGRNRYETFTSALKTAVVENKLLADEIRRGLEQDEFVAYYQPQFCPATLDIIGVEALARWNHPRRGLLAPLAFLKTAEDIDLVAELDEQILVQALAQAERWDACGLAIPKISVNLSFDRLRDETLIPRLTAMAIPHGRLAFELLESIVFDEADTTMFRNIEGIKRLGIDIEMDDFGTGYASITSLLKLMPKRLKIDRALVTPMLTSAKQSRLVASIIDIGKSLGIEVIAEGVETRAHAELLRAIGCHGLQGYAFARPMSADDVLDFVARRSWAA